jgi:hypothetical protein
MDTGVAEKKLRLGDEQTARDRLIMFMRGLII